MHYHSPHHGEPRLRRAARSPHGETQLPSTTTLPEPPAPLQGASAPAVGASSFDRMQAELKAVQQQALATQQSLQQLEARKPVDAYTAIASHLPGFSTVDSAVLGVGSAMVLAAVVVWWYVWQRPRTRWIDAGPRRMQVPSTPSPAATPTAPPSVQPSQVPPGEPGETEGWSPSTASGEFSTHGFEPSTSPFARQEPNMAFDPAAAASEVMRVRKSLAEKREARAHFLEREDAIDPDLDLDLDLDAVHTPAAALQAAPVPAPAYEPEPEPEPELDLDLDLPPPDPWRLPGESTPGTSDAQSGDAIHFSLALEDYGVKPATDPVPDIQPPYTLDMDLTPQAAIEAAAETPPMHNAPAFTPDPELVLEVEVEVEQPPPAAGAKTYDYTITMALAEESAALELWNEARDLAAEVLASDNAALVAQAQALLERLNQLEQDAPPDTNWGTVR